MEHLTIEEILDFISINKLDEKSMKLISKVNTHIFRCDECFEKVKAFQQINEEFEHMSEEKRLEALKAKFLKEKELEPLELEAESEEKEMEM